MTNHTTKDVTVQFFIHSTNSRKTIQANSGNFQSIPILYSRMSIKRCPPFRKRKSAAEKVLFPLGHKHQPSCNDYQARYCFKVVKTLPLPLTAALLDLGHNFLFQPCTSRFHKLFQCQTNVSFILSRLNVHVTYIHNSGSHLTENTLRVHYKDQYAKKFGERISIYWQSFRTT